MTFVIVMGFHQIIVVMNDVKRHTFVDVILIIKAHSSIKYITSVMKYCFCFYKKSAQEIIEQNNYVKMKKFN